MLNVLRILVSATARRFVLACSVVALLGACGQKGPLFMPNTPAAANRATLPESLRPTTTQPLPPTPVEPGLALPAPGAPAPLPAITTP